MKGPGPPAGRAGSAAAPRPGPERPEPQKKIGAIGADSRNSAIFIVDRNFPNDTFSKESRFFETLRICKSEKAPFELIITWWARARNIGNLEVEILLCRCRCRCYAQTNQWALSPPGRRERPNQCRHTTMVSGLFNIPNPQKNSQKKNIAPSDPSLNQPRRQSLAASPKRPNLSRTCTNLNNSLNHESKE